MQNLIYLKSRYDPRYIQKSSTQLVNLLKKHRYEAETEELKQSRLELLEELLIREPLAYTKEILDDIYVRHFPVV